MPPVPSYGFAAAGNALELSIRLYEGTLKYYYPNYKDYYYLIYEDTAVHKSVGEYVDRDARIKATKETCYTKKSGVFLPQPEPVWIPEFKTSSKDRTGFFEFSALLFPGSRPAQSSILKKSGRSFSKPPDLLIIPFFQKIPQIPEGIRLPLFLQHTEHLIQLPFGFRVHGQNILVA